MRAWPEPKLKLALSQWMGCSRFIYNAKCDEQEYFYCFSKSSLSLAGIQIPCDQSYSQFKTEATKFLEDCPSQILRNSAVRWYEAMQRFFKGLAGLPVRKKKAQKDSVWLTKELFRFDQVKDPGTGEVRRKLWIGTKTKPLGYLSFEEHREFREPASITISKKNGEYFVSLSYEDPKILSRPPEEVLVEVAQQTDSQILQQTLGLDRGIKRPFQGSDGKIFDFSDEQKRSIERKQKQIVKGQRRLSRQQLGSRRRERQKTRIGGDHKKIANIRKDFAHKTSHALAESEFRVFAYEDLKVRNMTKAPVPRLVPEAESNKDQIKARYLPNGAAAKAGLTKKILNAAWTAVVTFLAYKAARRDKAVIIVNPHDSSQECASCGHTHPDNRKTQERFSCVVCGHTENADLNASKVIRKRGLAKIREEYARGTRVSARRGNRKTIRFRKRAGAQAQGSENLDSTSSSRIRPGSFGL